MCRVAEIPKAISINDNASLKEDIHEDLLSLDFDADLLQELRNFDGHTSHSTESQCYLCRNICSSFESLEIHFRNDHVNGATQNDNNASAETPLNENSRHSRLVS